MNLERLTDIVARLQANGWNVVESVDWITIYGGPTGLSLDISRVHRRLSVEGVDGAIGPLDLTWDPPEHMSVVAYLETLLHALGIERTHPDDRTQNKPAGH